MSKDLTDRIREHKERPDAILALDKMLNISIGFLESSKSVPADQQYFTEVEVRTLEKLVTETIEWRNKNVAQQDATPPNQTPVLTVRMLAEKIDAMDREVSTNYSSSYIIIISKPFTVLFVSYRSSTC